MEKDKPNWDIFYHCQKTNWIEIPSCHHSSVFLFRWESFVYWTSTWNVSVWMLPRNASAWMKKQKQEVSVKAEIMQILVCTNRDCSFRGWGLGLWRELNSPNHRVWDVLYAFYELNFHFNTNATYIWKIIHSQLLCGTVTISRNAFTKKPYERFFSFSILLCNASNLKILCVCGRMPCALHDFTSLITW